MSRWEHRNVIVDFGNRPPRVQWISGERLDERHAPAFYDYLEQLGNEGWEMIGFASDSFWFKRRLE